MARCDNCMANKVCDHNKYGFENCGHYIPADVAPKSEVETLEKEIERLTGILNSYALQYGTVMSQQKVIDNAKGEVAREIFEAVLDVYKDTCDADFEERFAELKKKYTDGE